MARTAYTVGPMGNGSRRWKVESDGTMVSKHNKKARAVDRARELADGTDTITIQKRDGTFQKQIQPRA